MRQALFANWSSLCNKYSSDNECVIKQWNQIESAYTAAGRFYHNLQHLENMLGHLPLLTHQIDDADCIRFATFYHDFIYHTGKKDNEAKSAEVAEEAMHQLGIPLEQIKRCRNHIIATASHQESADEDTSCFLDLDLVVLGADWETYKRYAHNVRQEFKRYPDFIYKPGRRKVLRQFLEYEFIYKTQTFRERFESQAKLNLKQELNSL